MFDYFYYLIKGFGLQSGIVLCLIVSVITTIVIMSSVIVIGFIVDKFEALQYKFLARVFSKKTAFRICNYLTFPGVMIHELSHALVAWFTGAKVTELRLLEPASNGRLGHVSFSTRGPKSRQSVQLSFTSCAPVITGMILVPTFFKVIFRHSLGIGWVCFFWYMLVSVADHMSMSEADVKNYLRGIVRLIPIIFGFSLFVTYLLIDK